MTQQVINIGSAPDDHTGDPLRTAFTKTNGNFTELYTASGASLPLAGGTLTGNLVTFNGSAATPGLSFSTFTTTGFYCSGGPNLNVTTGGAQKFVFGGVNLSTVQLVIPVGAVGAPALYFSGATTTGFWYASSTINVTVGGTNKLAISATAVAPTVPVRMASYTVATLPTGTQGDRAMVTDATSPTFLGALTGGGSVKCPVFYNGTAWVAG